MLSPRPQVHALLLIVVHHQVLLVLSERLVEHVDVVVLLHEGLLDVLKHVIDLVHGQRTVLLLLARSPYDLQLKLPQLLVHLPMQLSTACLAVAAQSTIFALEQLGGLIYATALPAVAECLAMLFALMVEDVVFHELCERVEVLDQFVVGYCLRIDRERILLGLFWDLAGLLQKHLQHLVLQQ